MTKLTKMYALVATRYDDNNNPSMYIIRDSLTEKDLIEYQNYHAEYNRLWQECYAKEKENRKNKISENLRDDLNKITENKNSVCGTYSMRYYHDIWEEKQLIIEHFYI